MTHEGNIDPGRELWPTPLSFILFCFITLKCERSWALNFEVWAKGGRSLWVREGILGDNIDRLWNRNFWNLLRWSCCKCKIYRYRLFYWDDRADNLHISRKSCNKTLLMKWRPSQLNRNKKLRSSPKKLKIFGSSTGLEPVASAFALQCSTSWAMKTHTWRAGQFTEFINPRERTWKDMMWTAGEYKLWVATATIKLDLFYVTKSVVI